MNTLRTGSFVGVATLVAGGLTLAGCTSDESPTFDAEATERFIACLETNGLTAKLGDVPRALETVFVRLGQVDWIEYESKFGVNTMRTEYDPDSETYPDGTVQDLILSTIDEPGTDGEYARWVAPADAEAFGETQFADFGRVWAACEAEVPEFAQQELSPPDQEP